MRPRNRAQRVTILEVAREAGVSPATVSRVINGAESVEGELRDRVLVAVKKLDYRPNPFARRLHGYDSNVVGVLVPQLENEFYSRLISAIEGRLSVKGYHIICSLGHDDAASENEAIARLKDRFVDGYILLADRVPEARLRDLARQRVPLVLLNRHLDGLEVNCIGLDHTRGAYVMTKHLLELGHTKVGHIAGPLELPGARKRFEGYKQALLEFGIEPVEELVVTTKANEEGGLVAMRRLLAQADVTAVFVGGDKLAVGALSELHRQGIAVPGDISLAGFDDAAIAPYTYPPLTTMHYPVVEMGNQAADRLLAMLRREPLEVLPLLQPELVVRSSTARLGE